MGRRGAEGSQRSAKGDELDDQHRRSERGETEKEIEGRMKRLEKEATRHANAVASILEEDAQEFQPCPLCLPFAPGFRLPVPPSEQEWATITAAVFGGESMDYGKATDASACPDCNALGQVLTGSKVASHRLRNCSRCSGAGYLVVPGPAGNQAAVAPSDPTAPVVQLAPEPPSDTDPWGRVRTDPLFGVMPGYER